MRNHHIQNASIKSIATALIFAVIAGMLRAGIYFTGPDALNMPQAVSIGEKAFLVSTTLSAVFFLRWLIADAPFNLLRRYTFAPLLKTFVSVLLTFGGLLFLLHSLLGLNIVPLFTTSAVITGIIVFSMQDTIKNLFTGLWINMERIVAKGDWVRVADKEGQVMDVTWRTTRLLTRENDYIFLPNRLLADGVLENYTFPNPLHIVDLNVSASYNDPPNKVKDVLIEMAAHAHGIAAEPEPVVWVTGYGEFSVHYRLRVWINDFRLAPDVQSDLAASVWYAFRRSRITMPYPVRAVHHMRPDTHAPGTDIMATLKSIDFLGALDDTALQRVADYSSIEVFGHGEAIVREGTEGRTCYYILSGDVDILHRGQEAKETLIAALKAGGLFGEMSLLTGERRNATALAKEDTTCLVIESGAFKRIFNENPQAAARLSELLASRRAAHHEIKTRTKSKPEARQEDESRILAGIRKFFNLR